MMRVCEYDVLTSGATERHLQSMESNKYLLRHDDVDIL
jgi:hypothetical protein